MNRQDIRASGAHTETRFPIDVSKSPPEAVDGVHSELHETRSLRALHALQALASSSDALSLAALSESLHIPKASLMRLLQALEDEGFVQRDLARQAFALGPAMATLGLQALQNPALALRYRPVLAQLVQRLGESCNLTALAGDAVVYLDRVETSHPLRMTLAPGDRVPLHCTASGKLFLAEMPRNESKLLLERLPLVRKTPQTVCQPALLITELDRIRRQGYGVDNEEFIKGMVAVAVPVRDRSGHCVAAVACHAPTARYALDELIGCVDALKLAAVRMADILQMPPGPGA
jgi:DNA-binding IclR family transcriptional regulator